MISVHWFQFYSKFLSCYFFYVFSILKTTTNKYMSLSLSLSENEIFFCHTKNSNPIIRYFQTFVEHVCISTEIWTEIHRRLNIIHFVILVSPHIDIDIDNTWYYKPNNSKWKPTGCLKTTVASRKMLTSIDSIRSILDWRNRKNSCVRYIFSSVIYSICVRRFHKNWNLQRKKEKKSNTNSSSKVLKSTVAKNNYCNNNNNKNNSNSCQISIIQVN